MKHTKGRSLYSSVKLVIISGHSSELIDESECVERETERGTERWRDRERERERGDGGIKRAKDT